jgi:DNA replication and repair protein RecF
MHLEKLSLVNFKNYKQAEISLSPTINCFIGHNGAGKTNLLDAVYYLSMCKSYLNPIDSQNILFSESFFVVQGVWNKQDKPEHLYCAVKKGAKKVLKKNKVIYEKLSDHIGQFPVVMISPYDRNLILEGSEVRRRWMDGIIAQFNRSYLEDLIRYNKVLDQRNALLKNLSAYGFFDPESIAVWNEQLVNYGEKIFKVRAAFLQDFIPVFQKYHQLLTDDNEQVGLI